MQGPDRRRVLLDGLGFGEAPRWHDGALWCSDIACGDVWRLDADGTATVVCHVPGQPSGLGWLPDGRLLVVSMQQRAVLRLEPEGLVVHTDLSALVAAELNDMIVDAAGNAYVTNFGYDAETEPRRSTNLVLVRPDGSATLQTGELYRPNGCAITADGAVLVVAETRVHRLTAFRIAEDATLHDPWVFAELPAGSWADGICLDAEGAVWVADPKARRCVRILEGSVVTDVIDTSPAPCIACVLGGPDRRLLHLVLGDLGPFAERAARRASRIEVVEADVPGAGRP